MRFPSIIPSVPGAVDPRYTAQQQAMHAEKLALEARNPNAKPSPSPGIGRITLVPSQAWGAVKRMSNAFVSAPKRMSNAFVAAPRRMSAAWRTGVAERRASAMSVPSIYSVATTGPLPPQQQQSGRAYDNNRWYTGTQLSPIRPLQLPNRQAPPPSSYAPSTRSAASRVKPPPSASLRDNRNGWGANGLPPTVSNRGADLGYYTGPTTSRTAANPTSPKGNRLKPTTRYNLL